jgi:hypothetical protein
VVRGGEDPGGVGVEQDAAEEEEEELGEGGDGEHRAGSLRAVARWWLEWELAKGSRRGWLTPARADG